MTETQSTTDSSNPEQFLATLRKRFSQAVSDESEVRAEAKTDQLYVAGGIGQWSADAIQQRTEDKRPIISFNRLPIFIQSVANEARMNKPQPKVNAVDDKADVKTAKTINGLLRHIQYSSRADIAYDGSLEAAASSSFGFFRFITQYCEPDSFEQEIVVKPVLDPFTVYGVITPNCLGRPVEWAFVIERIPRDEFKRQRPDSKAADLQLGSEELQSAGGWFGEDDVQVAEYWYRIPKTRTLLLLADGKKLFKDELGEIDPSNPVRSEREVTVYTVNQCKTNGIEFWDETEWLDDVIPIIGTYGKQLIVNGRVKLFSLIRFLREPQQAYNFTRCAILEKLALANRVPYIGVKGTFESPRWRDANRKNYATLEYEPVEMPNGAFAPAPQRQQLEEQIQALSQEALQIADEMKAIVGIFDASLGDQGNETSGIAIGARQRQSNITNLHYSDNLNRAQWDGCLIMLRLIRKVYHEPGRVARIIGDDDTHERVQLNAPYVDEKGVERTYDLSAGKYDVVVTTGPSYTTARQEAAAELGELIKAEPQLINIMGDIWARVQDTPWSEELATRFKKMLPPALQDNEGKPQVPPEVQQQMQQYGQLVDQLTAQVHQLAQEIEAKKAELESRERIAALQEETKRTLGLAALDAKDGVAMLAEELANLKAQREQEHAVALQAADHAHQQQMQGAQQEQAAQSQAAQHEHEAGQQQAAAEQTQQTTQETDA